MGLAFALMFKAATFHNQTLGRSDGQHQPPLHGSSRRQRAPNYESISAPVMWKLVREDLPLASRHRAALHIRDFPDLADFHMLR
jgi:hypothetical protein